MKSRLFSAAAVTFAVLLVVMSPVSASAQVAIWPGSVVAPFVHVQWNGRQVHVCAPFVNLVVDLPRCCAAPPSCCEACGTGGAYSQSNRELYGRPTRQQLARSASKLFDSLDQFQTADSWRNYLALSPGETLSAEAVNYPSDTRAVDNRLLAVLRRFDATNRQAEYRQITALPEFQQTHTLLANYLAQQPRSPDSRTKPLSVMLASSSASPVSHAAQAVDIARVAVAQNAPTSNEQTAGAPKQTHPTIEELPPQIQKSGI